MNFTEYFLQIQDLFRQSIPYLMESYSRYSAVAQEIHFENPKLILFFVPVTLLFLIPLSGEFNRRKKFFIASRALILILLFMAVAEPYKFREDESIMKKSTITVLVDGSESMKLYPAANAIADSVYSELKEKAREYTSEGDVKTAYFSRGNKTALGDALYQNIVGSTKENNVIVLVSDGVSNYGKTVSSITRLVADSNTTIYPVLPGVSVWDACLSKVSGAAKVPVESDYEIQVQVTKTGLNESDYRLKLYVDGRDYGSRDIVQENESKDIGFTLRFSEAGLHTIDVELSPQDRDLFDMNNRITKTVEVVEKPSILLVSSEPNSPLSQIIKRLYEVEEAGSLPRTFEGYSAVYIDNVDSEHLDSNIKELRDYVTDGNGLVVVGGNKSYDWGEYNNSFIENLLPVRSREKPKEKRKPMTVLFLIDISGSGEYTGVTEQTINLEKSMAIKIIEELDLNDSLGVIAFNDNAFPVSYITPVETSRSDVEDLILRLKPGGNTDMVRALEMADDFLKDETNERSLVLFSDGIIKLSRAQLTVDAIKTLMDKGVRVYLVAVGGDRVGLATMNTLADATGALFFQPAEYQRLRLTLKRDAEEDEGNIALAVYNPYHFITRNLFLSDTEIRNYNKVKEKLNSQILISTEGGQPILTVWRFGLGKVASLTTDSGFNWATSLYMKDAAKTIPSLTNWIVGDLEKNKEVVVEASDTFMGENSLIIVRSMKSPMLKVLTPSKKEEQYPIKGVGIKLYSDEITPKEEGVYVLKAASEDGEDVTSFAVNYPKEFSETGVNLETLETLARVSQGRVYSYGESAKLIEDIVFDTKSRSEVKSKEREALKMYFIAAALGLYFLDTVARRLLDIMSLSGD